MAPQAKPVPLKLFYSYSHRDEKLRDKLDNHLALLQRQGLIEEWHDRMIEAGDDWESEISTHLETAEIILLLVSDDFIASDYCYSVEMQSALERHERGEARVIPVILRPVDWESSPLGELQALPKNAKPISLWRNRDEALKNVAQGIRKVIRSFKPKQKSPLASSPIPRRPVYGFVARRDADGHDILTRLKEELAPGSNQLVTLSGPGGIGKTTLAAEAARALQEAYGNRVVWSSAEGRSDFTLLSVLDDIATQLGRADIRTLTPADKEEQVRALVVGALVVLDNYETVAEPERVRIEAWFKQTPCSALFTSRPRVPDTVFVPVSAMSREEAEEFLEKLAEQTQDPQLFAPEVRERVYRTAEANPFVMQWVVGQIDLAQEPGTVLEELKHGKGDAALRVFGRSFELPLLGDDGRDALLALSLFAPSATPEALSAVAGFSDEELTREAVKNLRRLWLVKGVDGNRRLAVEGLTRTLAAAHLSKDPRAGEFRRRFVFYFLNYALERAESTPENYDTLEEEKDNLLGAAEAAFTSRDWGSGMRLAYVLSAGGILIVRGYWDEAVRLGEQALQAARSSQDEAAIASFSHNVAILYGNRGQLIEARRLYEESLEIEKKVGNRRGVADTLHQLAILAKVQGEMEKARGLFDESLAISKQLDDQLRIALTVWGLGNISIDQRDFDEAKKLFYEALETFRNLGDQANTAGVLHQLGKLAHVQGEMEEAHRLYGESLEITKRLGNQNGIAITLNNLAILADGRGDKEEAARLLRESLNIFERLGSSEAESVRQSLARVEGQS